MGGLFTEACCVSTHVLFSSCSHNGKGACAIRSRRSQSTSGLSSTFQASVSRLQRSCSLKLFDSSQTQLHCVQSFHRFMLILSCVLQGRCGIQQNASVQIKAELCEKEKVDTLLISKDVKAPLIDALVSAAQRNVSGFHFPGHNRGKAAPPLLTQNIGKDPFYHDLPELPELDNLFNPQGPICEAQQRAALLFGAEETRFLVGGSTCGVQAAVMTLCPPGSVLVLPRNSHMSVFSAMVMSGAVPKYIIPDYNSIWSITHGIRSSQVKEALDQLREEDKQAAAVFITSPTYFGICSDIEGIAQICHAYGIPLIVDEAHGGHFKFHSTFPKTALEQGADLVVQSTHKVLCSLTQSAMLHVQGKIVRRDILCQCLQTLQSSSPSYLLLASLDATCAYIAEYTTSTGCSELLFKRATELADEARSCIKQLSGIHLLDSKSLGGSIVIDPLRITVGFCGTGLQGFVADDILTTDYGVIAELPTLNTLTFAINLGTNADDIRRLVNALESLLLKTKTENGSEIKSASEGHQQTPFPVMKQMLSPREAFFARKTKVDMHSSVGQICGELICPYPPGIPILIPGEIISENALSYLQNVLDGGAMITGASDPCLSSILVCMS